MQIALCRSPEDWGVWHQQCRLPCWIWWAEAKLRCLGLYHSSCCTKHGQCTTTWSFGESQVPTFWSTNSWWWWFQFNLFLKIIHKFTKPTLGRWSILTFLHIFHSWVGEFNHRRPAFSKEAEAMLLLRRPNKGATTDVVARRLIAGKETLMFVATHLFGGITVLFIPELMVPVETYPKVKIIDPIGDKTPTFN